MRLLALVACLLCLPAAAQYSPVRSQSWVVAVSPVNPSNATVGCIGGAQATRGYQLDSIKRLRVTVQLGSTGTLSSGYLVPWVWDPQVQLWIPNYTEQLFINGGFNAETLGTVQSPVAAGCVYYVPLNITFSGSSTTVVITVTGVTQ